MRIFLPDFFLPYYLIFPNCQIRCPQTLQLVRWVQWRNATIWCPPALIFGRPHKFFTVSQKKKKKKGRHFFIGFLPPWTFLYPQIFFSRRPNAKLAELWFILLLCQTIFRLKNCKFGNMPPP